jgi:hypothetical protein
MLTKTRNKTAGIIAIIGGLLILIGGGTGMVRFLSELSEIVQDLLGGKNETVETIFWILIIIAALGGISVIIGGLLIYKEHVVIGKILIALGAGIGVIGLILGIITAFAKGEELQFFSWLTTSLMGVGLVLSLVARMLAKRPGPI